MTSLASVVSGQSIVLRTEGHKFDSPPGVGLALGRDAYMRPRSVVLVHIHASLSLSLPLKNQ